MLEKRGGYIAGFLGCSLFSLLCTGMIFQGQTWMVDNSRVGEIATSRVENPGTSLEHPLESKQSMVASAWSQKRDHIDMSEVTTAEHMLIGVINPRTVYQVGDTLVVRIVARDAKGRQKTNGGDFLLAKLCTTAKSRVKACTAGQVTDRGNGVYIARFFLSWPGSLAISVRLGHSSESVEVLKRIRDNFLDRRVTKCSFVDEISGEEEWVHCTFSRNDSINPRDICDYSRSIPNATWYCQRPTRVKACQSITACNRDYPASLKLHETMVTASEAALFNSTLANLDVPNKVKITVKGNRIRDGVEGKTLPPCGPQLAESSSEGYWYNKTWHSLRCKPLRIHSSPLDYKCLRNKSITILGDSTGRQYFGYLEDLVQKITAQLPEGKREWERKHKSMKVDFVFHTFPRNHGTPALQVRYLKYVADEVDRIVGGPNMMVVLCFWAHYNAEPLETFRSRVWGIRYAIERLLNRYPDTKIVWRTGAMQGHVKLEHFLENSNWYTHQLIHEAKQILGDLNIFILDVWEMSLCEEPFYSLHPGPDIIKGHVEMMLSYLCSN
ncbi:PREDICTED: NXPE family member 1-like [Branchiostoma belcheri]|uniref:NXPE family member 1-like n=1 Tax=Branchiostoma belcheri TaxID=7741 RepID=A0A6P4Y1Y6_BRABE|nr:PREDICTED: NXPE family member 1-like [Branchiostoma belcheri]